MKTQTKDLVFGEVYKDETLGNDVYEVNELAMTRICRGFGYCDTTIEDITQNVFMELWKAIVDESDERMDESFSVRQWLLGRTKWRCIDELRKSTREAAVFVHVEPEVLESFSDNATPSNLSPVMLEDRLNLLSPRQREAVELCWQGYENHEIADMLGISRPAVTQLMNRAGSNLQTYYED